MADNSSLSGADAGQGGVPGRVSQKFDTHFEKLDVDGQALEVLSISNMPAHLDRLLAANAIHDPLRDLPLWAKIWPASFVLGRFLRKYEPAGKSLLELGAGMGICSLIAARYGFARIVATDINEDALDFARANVLRNNLQETVSVATLDVAAGGTNPRFKGFDFIAASELLYIDDLHRPLLKFIGRHLARGGKAFLCSDLAREKPRFRKLASQDFSVSEGRIGVKSQDEDGQEQRRIFSMMILERK